MKMSEDKDARTMESEMKENEAFGTHSGLESDIDSTADRTEMAGAEAVSPEATARADAEMWREKYLRQLAEFDNFRKRTRQDMEMLRETARESLIVKLLSIKDDFDRMLDSQLKSDEAFCKGVELIHNKLNAFIEAYDVKVMEGRGAAFDPSRHDALIMQPTNDFPSGTILEVITPGYVMGDRVIRHAQVVVSSEADSDAESSGEAPKEEA
jgi:molecular chaperone GrpE